MKKYRNDRQLNTMIADFLGEPCIQCNKSLIKIYDLQTALWFGDVFSRWNYFDKEHKTSDGYFCVEQNKIFESTQISRKQQTKIIKQLSDDGVINIKRKGIPAKNWYKINFVKLIEKINEKGE